MKVFYDLHIHSMLSACADELQTPNNILNMCMLKGLNLISITDHNSLKQYESIEKIKDSYQFNIIYGVEITVKEGFHVLAYFENILNAKIFDRILDNLIDKTIQNNNDVGRQIIYDEYDNEIQNISYKLNQPISLGFKEIVYEIRKLDGLVVIAHIDRPFSSFLNIYNELSDFDFDAIEISTNGINNDYFKKNQFLKDYKIITNSDAHSIEIINECVNSIELTECSFNGFKRWLKNE